MGDVGLVVRLQVVLDEPAHRFPGCVCYVQYLLVGIDGWKFTFDYQAPQPFFQICLYWILCVRGEAFRLVPQLEKVPQVLL